MQRHSKRLNKLGFHKLKILEVEKTDGKIPKVMAFVLDYFDKSKKLTLHPTKGYRLENRLERVKKFINFKKPN